MTPERFVSNLIRELHLPSVDLSEQTASEYRKFVSMSFKSTLDAVRTNDPDFVEIFTMLIGLVPDARDRTEISPAFASLTLLPSSVRARGLRTYILERLRILVETGRSEFDVVRHVRGVPIAFIFDAAFPLPGVDRGGCQFGPARADRNLSGKLHRAWTLLNAFGSMGDFVSKNTDLIILREEHEFPDRFSSGSFRLMPGTSLLCNSHLLNVSEYEIADALLHESIHSLIYRYEALGSRLIAHGSENQADVTSPWTGAELHLDSFVQACFVWFGLFSFWDRTHEGGARRLSLLNRAGAGFCSPRYEATCRRLEDIFSPGVGEQMIDLGSRVRRAVE